MSKRTEWTFMFSKAAVRTACRSQLQHHRKRAAWWKKEAAKAEKALKSSVKVRELAVSGGYRHEAVFEHGPANRLSECQNKIVEHENAAATYSDWMSALLLAPARKEFSLDFDDLRFFRLI